MADSDWQEAYAKAIYLLARREHAAAELRDKLSQKGFSSQAVEEALEQLREQNLQSDERYAEVFVRSRAQRGHGPVKIRNDLRQREVAEHLIDDLIGDSDHDWLSLAHQQYQKKYRNTPVSNYNEWSKRARFLQSRGFTTSQIKTVIQYDRSETELL